jgi:hypothetical protein
MPSELSGRSPLSNIYLTSTEFGQKSWQRGHRWRFTAIRRELADTVIQAERKELALGFDEHQFGAGEDDFL